MFDRRLTWKPSDSSAGAEPTARRWFGRPLVALGVPVLIAALGGVVLTSQAALAGQDAPAVTCTLTVPAEPLSAKGLATPYRLEAPCHEADAGSAAFVQATIIDPATGAVSVYDPLVIDAGSRPAAPPTPPKLPAGAVVGIWFGFNGDDLRLAGDHGSLAAGRCVNGEAGSIFGQFAYCNAPALFSAANTAIAAGRLSVPTLGTAADGRPCPTTRDFGLVDMDQSDNVTTTYLVLADGTTAQNTAANRAALARRGARVEVNGSDNALLDAHVFPALGCTPYRAPDLADAGAPATSLALNELQAAAHQAAPVALVPTSDPMTKAGDKQSVAKTDLYRAGVGQPAVDARAETPKVYCANLLQVGTERIELDRSLTVRAPSPDPEAANSLFTFLAQRFSGAYDALDCPRLLRTKNPVTVTTDAKGVAVSARLTVPPHPSASPSHSPTRPASASASPSAAAPVSTSPPATRQPGHSVEATHTTTTAPPQTTVQTTQPPQTTIHTTQPPATTQPPPPVHTTAQAAHPVQTGQAGAPGTTGTDGTGLHTATTATTSAAPAAADPPGDTGAPTGGVEGANADVPGLAVDAMRLKDPKHTTAALTGASLASTTIGVTLLVGGAIGCIAAIVHAIRRNRGRYFPAPDTATTRISPW
ncbi:hypothetical protein Dvina_19540 [Dactylosporangium vinaceum]|uniref:Uncharacterized protein n=1 Tax=Dactylosporangium vinaceum TaxID=53362 RepID=A0ABV5M9M3_9ACTN|nr:hypothetical protein [Dactylosporangium vinaceum]UAC00055.1 hypothetical protein Dvina_19540 [Dactylosporangium vinaceum]